MNSTHTRPLDQIIYNSNGKISLAKSKHFCHTCHHYALQNTNLRNQLLLLTQILHQEKKKNQSMDLLCYEIGKTKQKMIRKLQEKKQQINKLLFLHTHQSQTIINHHPRVRQAQKSQFQIPFQMPGQFINENKLVLSNIKQNSPVQATDRTVKIQRHQA